MTAAGRQLETPVAFIVFNRPHTTRVVFEEIRKVRPQRLLVVADGPRPEKAGEEERCREVRSIIEGVDWDCQVETNYAEKNLGCGLRVRSGIDWVFEQVEEAIILEDDCLPHPSFFPFCRELLERYRNDPRVAQIGGVNFQFGRAGSPYSYYFSRYNHIWGWASWRRAWQLHDHGMSYWPEYRDRGALRGLLSGKGEVSYWTDVLDRVHSGEIDTWDCQWTFSCWRHGLLTVLPSVNLVSNIGFGPGATHTPVPNRFAAVPTKAVLFPLVHPPAIEADAAADRYTGNTMFQPYTALRRLFAVARSFFWSPAHGAPDAAREHDAHRP